jgi:hypothetical protein
VLKFDSVGHFFNKKIILSVVKKTRSFILSISCTMSYTVIRNYLIKLKELEDATDSFQNAYANILAQAADGGTETTRPLIDNAVATEFVERTKRLSELEGKAFLTKTSWTRKPLTAKGVHPAFKKFVRDMNTGDVTLDGSKETQLSKINGALKKPLTQKQEEELEELGLLYGAQVPAPQIGKLPKALQKRLTAQTLTDSAQGPKVVEAIKSRMKEIQDAYAERMAAMRETQAQQKAEAKDGGDLTQEEKGVKQEEEDVEFVGTTTEKQRTAMRIKEAEARGEVVDVTGGTPPGSPPATPPRSATRSRQPASRESPARTVQMAEPTGPVVQMARAADPGESTSAERIAQTATATRQEIVVPVPAPQPAATTLEPVHEAADPIRDASGANVSQGEARAAAAGHIDNPDAGEAYHREQTRDAAVRAQATADRTNEAMARERASEQTHTAPVGPEARLREQEAGQSDFQHYLTQIDGYNQYAATMAGEGVGGFGPPPVPQQSGYTEFAISGAPRSRSSTETSSSSSGSSSSDESVARSPPFVGPQPPQGFVTPADRAAAAARVAPYTVQAGPGGPSQPPTGQAAVTRIPRDQPDLAEGRFELEDVPRDGGGGIGASPGQIMQQPGAPDSKTDEEQVKGLSIEAAKNKIRALHTVYDSQIPAFREKAHTKAKDDALQSSDKKIVHAHLLDMLKKVREFYTSGKGAGLQVGVIVPMAQVLAALGGGAVGGGGGAPAPAAGPAVAATAPATGGVLSAFGAPEKEHPGAVLHREGEDRFGHAMALSIHRTSSGMAAHLRRGVRGHEVKNRMKVTPGPVSKPIIRMNQNCPESFRMGPVLGRRPANLGIRIKT